MKLQYNELNSNIRLINSAKMVDSRGGKMALLNPQPTVLDVLDLIGILQLIPVSSDLESAKAGLVAG